MSPEQLAANRANAKRSTGPRTQTGKAASSQNARKHRFNPDAFPVPLLEHPDQLLDLRADAVAFYRPQNSQEMFAVERIVLAQAAMLRAARMEAGLSLAALNTGAADPIGPENLAQRCMLTPLDYSNMRFEALHNFALAGGLIKHGDAQAWKVFLRFQSQSERLYRRAVEEFNRLKAERPDPAEQDFQNEPIFEPAAALDPLLSETPPAPPDPVKTKNAKRTQFPPEPQQTKTTFDLQNEPNFEPADPPPHIPESIPHHHTSHSR